MKSGLLLSVLALASVANAATLSVERGFEVHAINGQKTESQDVYQLNKGENQVVLSYSGNLSTGPDTELLSTKPYVVSLYVKESSELDVELISGKYKRVAKAVEKRAKWFNISDKQADVSNYTLEVLPSQGGFFPYSDIPALLADYNKQNKIYFAKGNLVDYDQAKKDQASNLAKLQSLYLDATPEEKKQFRKWIIDIE